jgi:hypothetical protein
MAPLRPKKNVVHRNGPHIEDGSVVGSVSPRQRLGYEQDTDRSKRGKRPAWEPRPRNQQQRNDHDREQDWHDREVPVAREDGGDRFI